MKWFKKERIIVPFDYSDASMHALRVGMALAEDKANVHLVHVLHYYPHGQGTYYLGEPDDEQRIAGAKQAIEKKIALADITGIQVDVLVGDPVNEIVGQVKDCETDLVVIPSHGYTGLKKMLLGSVAQGVVRHAQCPVLVLK